MFDWRHILTIFVSTISIITKIVFPSKILLAQPPSNIEARFVLNLNTSSMRDDYYKTTFTHAALGYINLKNLPGYSFKSFKGGSFYRQTTQFASPNFPILYVTGPDALYAFDGYELTMLAKFDLSYTALCKLDQYFEYCSKLQERNANTGNKLSKLKNQQLINHNKLLLLDRTYGRIIVCGTFGGFCQTIRFQTTATTTTTAIKQPSRKPKMMMHQSFSLPPLLNATFILEQASIIPTVSEYVPASTSAMLFNSKSRQIISAMLLRSSYYPDGSRGQSGPQPHRDNSLLFVGETYMGDKHKIWSEFQSSSLSLRRITYSSSSNNHFNNFPSGTRKTDSIDGRHQSSNSFALVNDGIKGGQSRLQVLKDFNHEYKIIYKYSFTASNFAYFVTIQPSNQLIESSDNEDGTAGAGGRASTKFVSTKISRVCLEDDSFHTYVEIPLICSTTSSSSHSTSKSSREYNVLKEVYFGQIGMDLIEFLSSPRTATPVPARQSNDKNIVGAETIEKNDLLSNSFEEFEGLNNDNNKIYGDNYNKFYRSGAGQAPNIVRQNYVLNKEDRALVAVFVKNENQRESNNNYNKNGFEDPVDILLSKKYGRHPLNEENVRLRRRSEEMDEDYAICVYPLKDIQKLFTQNIQMCYNGTFETRGLNHINPGNPKCITSNIEIGNDFCDTTKPNPRLEGRIPLSSQAVFEYKDSQFQIDPKVSNKAEYHPPNHGIPSALTIGVSGKRTIAFLGTRNGYLQKILLDEASRIYSSTRVVTGNDTFPINRDIFLDINNEHIYTFSNNQVKVASCNRFNDCKSCMDSNDPFCGWCTHDSKCSPQSECQANSVFSKWLPYGSKQCIYFNGIQPDKAELTQTIKVQLNISHLPLLVTSKSKYYCEFGTSQWIRANVQSWGLVCDLPPFDQRPAIDSNKGYAMVPLKIYAEYFGRKVLASQEFTFYDCSHLASCKECTSTQWNCNWCLYDNACIYNMQTCKIQKSNVNSVERCPKFDYDFKPNILIPNAVPTEISIRGKNLPFIKNTPIKYQCIVQYDNLTTILKATVDSNNNIFCQVNKYIYESNYSQMEGKLSVYWNKRHLVDTIQVTLYKCSLLADDCTLCFNLDPIFKCTWCQAQAESSRAAVKMIMESSATATNNNDAPYGEITKENNFICQHKHQCHYSSSTAGGSSNNFYLGGYKKGGMGMGSSSIYVQHTSQLKCPAPSILSIEPLYGPKEGGTLITITGHDLMKSYDDNVYVGIGDSPCLIENFEISRKLTCRTTYSPLPGKKMITIRMTKKPPPQTTTNTFDFDNQERQFYFEYLNVEIVELSPQKGPISGGTILKISGKNVNIGWHKKIYLDYIPCLIPESIGISFETQIDNNPNELQLQHGSSIVIDKDILFCVTQPVSSAPLRITTLKVEIDRFEKYVPIEFTYMPDPVITAIYPTESYFSGGRKIYITGNSLDLISRAYIFLDLSSYGITEYLVKKECKGINSTFIVCASPTIPLTFVYNASTTLNVPFGFIMDNILSLKNLTYFFPHLPSMLTYYPDPLFYPFTEDDRVKTYRGEPIIIQGNNLNIIDDIRIMIAYSPCLVNLVSENHMVCVPPPKKLISNDIELFHKGDNNETTFSVVMEENPPANSFPEVSWNSNGLASRQNGMTETGEDGADKILEKRTTTSHDIFPVWVWYGSIHQDIGYLRYVPYSSPMISKLHPNKPSKTMISVITASGFTLFLVLLIAFFLFNRKSKFAEKEFKRIQIQMETLESNVRSECKQAFAELQTDMGDINNDVFNSGIPFLDRNVYIAKIFFPEMPESERQALFNYRFPAKNMENPYELCATLLRNYTNTNTTTKNHGIINNEISTFGNAEKLMSSDTFLTTRTISRGHNNNNNNRSNKTSLLIDLSSSSSSSCSASSNKTSAANEAAVPQIGGPINHNLNVEDNELQQYGLRITEQNAPGGHESSFERNDSPTPNHVFGQLLRNHDFLYNFIDTLESQTTFTVKDKTRLASLLTALFLKEVSYTIEILMSLLAKLIHSTVRGRGAEDASPSSSHLFMRRTESVAEKMLTNCISLFMYDYVRDEVGIPFFYLFKALEYQINKGPLDAVTFDARYSLSEDRLLVDKVDYKILNIWVVYGDTRAPDDENPFCPVLCKVNDCDTITQVKAKALEILYKNVPFSARPKPHDLELIWKHGKYGPLLLEDEDSTSTIDPSCKRKIRINTLQHYRVNEGTTLTLLPIQPTNPYETIASKVVLPYPTDISNLMEAAAVNFENNTLHLYRRNDNINPIISDFNPVISCTPGYKAKEFVHAALGGPYSSKYNAYYSMKLEPKSFVKSSESTHPVNTSLVKRYAPLINTISSSTKKNDKKASFVPGNNKSLVKPLYWHLVDKYTEIRSMNNTSDKRYGIDRNDAAATISEIFLTRLLSTKGTIQKYVDDFFMAILTPNHSTLPVFIKYLFDYLDTQADKLNITDPTVVHSWKNNCLPLRFWINIIKNPNFILDVNKTPPIDSSLSVLAQTFMDSCSCTEHRLGKDSPSNKLLYAKEIPTYRKQLMKLYSDIRDLPPVKESDFRSGMAKLSKKHGWQMDESILLNQIFQYAVKYKTEIMENLITDQYCQNQNILAVFDELVRGDMFHPGNDFPHHSVQNESCSGGKTNLKEKIYEKDNNNNNNRIQNSVLYEDLATQMYGHDNNNNLLTTAQQQTITFNDNNYVCSTLNPKYRSRQDDRDGANIPEEYHGGIKYGVTSYYPAAHEPSFFHEINSHHPAVEFYDTIIDNTKLATVNARFKNGYRLLPPPGNQDNNRKQLNQRGYHTPVQRLVALQPLSTVEEKLLPRF